MYSFGPISIRAYVVLYKLFESNWIHLPILNSLIFRIINHFDLSYLFGYLIFMGFHYRYQRSVRTTFKKSGLIGKGLDQFGTTWAH